MSRSRPIQIVPLATILGACGAILLAAQAEAGAPARAPEIVAAASPVAPAPDGSEPRLVHVALSEAVPLERLMRDGFDVVRIERGRSATLLVWPRDEARLAALGAAVEVLDPAPGRSAAARARAELADRPAPQPKRVRSAVESDGVFRIHALPPFGAGSMAGYWTLAEVKMKLDDLVAGDAAGVVADQLDTLGTTWGGRPIWGLKLGKAASPVAFYNALTHAREGMSMQALLYFVDDLLGRYGSDPFATYLLDHRALYVVPVVNPDGYALNESLFVASGGDTLGLWRKNLRDNNDSGAFEELYDGVDLNRNYGYQWGIDDYGSTWDSRRETYRGPAAFSEPETQAQRDIIVALAPVTGLSLHTFGDLWLQPWSHTGLSPPQADQLCEWSDLLTERNAYQSGQPYNILYLLNGDFNDWCYGDTLAKPRTFAWTPEIGTPDDSFWAPPSRMVPLAEENLNACYVAAALAGAYVQADGLSVDEGALDASYGARLRVRARNHGAAATGAGLTGTLVPLDPGVQMLVASVPYPALGSRQSGVPVAPFELVVDDTVTAGRLMRFEVRFTTPGGLFARDTVRVPFGTPTVVAADGASGGLSQWSPGTWGIVANDPVHPSRYFADSPVGTYAANATNVLELVTPLDLSAGVHAYALYEARWEIESDYDALTVEASLDGTNWTPLPATGATPSRGFGVQTPGVPSYSGTRWQWRPEMADLSAFTGTGASEARVRFRLLSSDVSQFDGFNFDSLRIVVFDPAAQPPLVTVGGAPPAPLALAPPRPNPARAAVRFEFFLPGAAAVRLEVVDLQGRRLRRLADGDLAAGRHAFEWDGLDAAGRRAPPGVYLALLSDAARTTARRFAIIR